MNRAFIVGRLTQAPEEKVTPNGISVAMFTLAVPRRANREKADFLSVIAWRGLAESCARNLVKGQQVGVLGEIQTRAWEDKNGVKRRTWEIVADEVEFLGKPRNTGDDILTYPDED